MLSLIFCVNHTNSIVLKKEYQLPNRIFEYVTHTRKRINMAIVIIFPVHLHLLISYANKQFTKSVSIPHRAQLLKKGTRGPAPLIHHRVESFFSRRLDHSPSVRKRLLIPRSSKSSPFQARARPRNWLRDSNYPRSQYRPNRRKKDVTGSSRRIIRRGLKPAIYIHCHCKLRFFVRPRLGAGDPPPD